MLHFFGFIYHSFLLPEKQRRPDAAQTVAVLGMWQVAGHRYSLVFRWTGRCFPSRAYKSCVSDQCAKKWGGRPIWNMVSERLCLWWFNKSSLFYLSVFGAYNPPPPRVAFPLLCGSRCGSWLDQQCSGWAFLHRMHGVCSFWFCLGLRLPSHPPPHPHLHYPSSPGLNCTFLGHRWFFPLRNL